MPMEMTFQVAAEAAVETVAHASVVIVMIVVVVMIAAHAIVTATATATATVPHVNRVNHVSHVKTDLLKSLSKMNSRANFVLN
jgi:hypothetical protein